MTSKDSRWAIMGRLLSRSNESRKKEVCGREMFHVKRLTPAPTELFYVKQKGYQRSHAARFT
jgi:hypothetical protein